MIIPIYETRAFPVDFLVRNKAKAAPIRPPTSFVKSSRRSMLLSTAMVKPNDLCAAGRNIL